jgi:hypothetical protein
MHIKARDSMGDDTGFITIEKYYANTGKRKAEQEDKRRENLPCSVHGWRKKSNVLEVQFLSKRIQHWLHQKIYILLLVDN